MANKGVSTKGYTIAISLIISLFFMWALANSINGILIKHFRTTLHLTRYEAGFVDSAYYLGYFIMAIPSGLIINRIGYKGGILVGLLLFATGSYLFYPASNIGVYGLFLFSLFIVATGATFLETCANTYISKLGDSSRSSTRLNFAQGFNALGAIFASYIGSRMIFADENTNHSVYMPYLIIGTLALVLSLLFLLTRFPKLESDKVVFKIDWSILKRFSNLRYGVIAQFCYVGLQAAAWGYFLYVVHEKAPNLTDIQASKYFTYVFLLFMLGRFFGSYILKYIKPNILLSMYSIVNILLLILAGVCTGYFAVWCFILINFFMSIMYPTIFTLGINGIEHEAKLAGSFLVMAIIGGSVVPPIMGYIADSSGINIALVVPIICQLYIVYFGMKCYSCKHVSN